MIAGEAQSWNKREIVELGGKKFGLLDYNITDPDGEDEFSFRMIVLDTVVDDKVSHTVVKIDDAEAEKRYVDAFYAWIATAR